MKVATGDLSKPTEQATKFQNLFLLMKVATTELDLAGIALTQLMFQNLFLLMKVATLHPLLSMKIEDQNTWVSEPFPSNEGRYTQLFY